MKAYSRICFIRLFSINLALVFFIFFASSFAALAQTHFVPLERGDVSERKEHLTFSPGVELSGDYRLRTSKISSTNNLPISRTDTNSAEEFSFDQDLRLRMRSTVHRIISINLELATDQEAIYQSDIRTSQSSRTTGTESQSANLTARQSYLELNRNPNEEAKFGKHVINIGDRNGKVFSGILSGFSQRCKAGTWCYEIGGMKLSSADADWLYFFSLDYPVWHEVDSNGEVIDSFRIEMFRIKYTEHDVPLGLNNIPAKRLPSSTLSSLESLGFTSGSTCNSSLSAYTLNSNCKPIYYNAHEQEYFGIRILWETAVWGVYADIISNQGNRNYFQYDERHNIDKRKISGGATELEISWKRPGEEYMLVGMMAQGDEQLEDNNRNGANYLRSLKSFYEISPGTYRGTQFYFNGGSPELNSGTGLGHSINNTQMGGFRFRYEVPETNAVYYLGLYELKRIQPVLDIYGNKSSMIGIEWDNTLSIKMAGHANLDLDLNAFEPGSAFSYDDHTVPLGIKKTILHFAGRLTYSF